MTAGDEVNQLANIEGTHHALELADAIGARLFHHVSSVAVAGRYRGVFTEDMFDVGQPLEHPYHRTKFESERLVRETAAMPWRIYRPSIVVGDSRSGRMDKVDGPYYFLPLLRRAQRLVPDWLPLIGPELGNTNIVPVDFVAQALDHIAHEKGLNGRAFHLTDPTQTRVVDVLNSFARVAGAPQFAVTVDPGPLSRLPRGLASAVMALPGAHAARRAAAGRGRRSRRDRRLRRHADRVRHDPRARSAGRDGHRGTAAGLLCRQALELLARPPGSGAALAVGVDRSSAGLARVGRWTGPSQAPSE